MKFILRISIKCLWPLWHVHVLLGCGPYCLTFSMVFMHWPAKGHSRHVQLVFIRFIRFISILVLLSEFHAFHQKPLISENVGSMSLCFRTISSVPRWTKSSHGRQTNCDVSRCQKPWSLSTMSILDYERRRETWWSFTDAFCGDFGLCRVVAQWKV